MISTEDAKVEGMLEVLTIMLEIGAQGEVVDTKGVIRIIEVEAIEIEVEVVRSKEDLVLTILLAPRINKN